MYNASIYATTRKIIGYALADGFNPCELLAFQSFIDFVRNDGENSKWANHIRLVLGSYEEPVCYVQFPAPEDPDADNNKLYLHEYSINDDEELDEVYRNFYDKLMLFYSDLIK